MLELFSFPRAILVQLCSIMSCRCEFTYISQPLSAEAVGGISAVSCQWGISAIRHFYQGTLNPKFVLRGQKSVWINISVLKSLKGNKHFTWLVACRAIDRPNESVSLALGTFWTRSLIIYSEICPSGPLSVWSPVYGSPNQFHFERMNTTLLHTTRCVNTSSSSSLTLSMDNPKIPEHDPRLAIGGSAGSSSIPCHGGGPSRC